jgi:hypothetical protein
LLAIQLDQTSSKFRINKTVATSKLLGSANLLRFRRANTPQLSTHTSGNGLDLFYIRYPAKCLWINNIVATSSQHYLPSSHNHDERYSPTVAPASRESQLHRSHGDDAFNADQLLQDQLEQDGIHTIQYTAITSTSSVPGQVGGAFAFMHHSFPG